MQLPKQATIIEVSPRDGLQNENNIVPTDDKIHFIQQLKQTGIRNIELASFVSPKWIPQMKDAETIVAACIDQQTNYVLVPNKKGAERLYQTDCKNAGVFVGVSSVFNQKNINKTTRESMDELRPIIADMKAQHYFVRACISTAFRCPFVGKIAKEDTIALCQEFIQYGVDELCVADTIGMATPIEVYDLFADLKKDISEDVAITAHFHDTRGTALANIFAALQVGITRFDTSAGGLGGCPFAPGAAGNVATEDVIYMLEEMNIDTGVDLTLVKQAVDVIKPHISRPLTSKNYQYLTVNTLH